MRTSLTILLFLLAHSLFAQHTLTFSILLQSSADTVRSNIFDTVHIKGVSINRHFLPEELQINGNDFHIENLPSGTYKLKFVSKELNYDALFYYIVICSKCDNKFLVTAAKLKAGDLDLPQHPSKPFAIYAPFNLNSSISYRQTLQRDFFKALSKHEIAKIRKKPFLIRAFIVKDTGLCDISVEPNSLNKREKNIILKGFASLKSWDNCCKIAEIEITSQELFDD